MALTKITTSVVAANTLATANIADNSVDATKIASNSILTRHIDDDQITGDQLADNITIAGNLTITGNLTTNGSTVTNSSSNTTIEDAIIELGTGTSGAPATDAGILKGVNYSISSACSTSAHCIGHAAELIQLGKQDIIIAGGAEQEHWTSSSMFDAMGALSSQYNDMPERASRPFDANRDGFVIAGGAGMLILEEEEHAIKRNAPIIARLKGYCANSDGYDMVSPSGEGAIRCMSEAIEVYGSDVDYINAHGTSTPVGDLAELSAIKAVFGKNAPVIGSTKSMTGHSLGATGAQEAIYSILMMQNDFIAPSINIDNLVEEAEGLDICQSMIEHKLNAVMSNSFGFGGTNASLIFSK